MSANDPERTFTGLRGLADGAEIAAVVIGGLFAGRQFLLQISDNGLRDGPEDALIGADCIRHSAGRRKK